MIKLDEDAVVTGENEFVSWTLPSFDKDNNGIVSSEEKIAQDRQAAEVAEDESIDDVEADVEPLTAQQLEEIRLQAHKEGYQAGYDEGRVHGVEAGTHDGRKQGEQAVRAELEPALKSETRLLSDLTSQIQSLVDQQQEQLKPLILNMVTGLTRHFIEGELQQNPAILNQLVAQGVQALPGKFEELTVYVHPEQREVISQTLTIPDVRITVKADNNLGRWDGRIQSEFSQVMLDFDARWQALLEQFDSGELSIEPSASDAAIQDYAETSAPAAKISEELTQDLDAVMPTSPDGLAELDTDKQQNIID